MNLRPWQTSVTIHAALIGAFILCMLIPLKKETTSYEVPIYQAEPENVQQIKEITEKPKIVLKSVNHDNKSQTKIQSREVFGVSRNSHVDATGEGPEVSAKLGNSLAKVSDNTKLEDSDADHLPVPTEEYLVSEMPSILNEVKPVYPKEAREKQIEGAVTMNILIDEKGQVRQASIVDGPEIFIATALEAIKKFMFRPAKVDGKAVAVKIRYILRFKLEF